MATRVSGILSLLVFAICLVVGLEVDNTFATTVERALTAMMVTAVIGLVLGGMAGKMLDENLKSREEKLKKNSASSPQDDR